MQARVAVTPWLRALIQVFKARRLAELFLLRVHADRAGRNVAARMRLNRESGFNPLKFERALQGLLRELDGGVARHQRCPA